METCLDEDDAGIGFSIADGCFVGDALRSGLGAVNLSRRAMIDERLTLENLRRHLLDEAVAREVHADWLSDLAAHRLIEIHPPTLQVVAHAQRIRALELRGQAAALAQTSAFGHG